MFWKLVARWISQAPTCGNASKASALQRRGAVLHRAGQPVLLAGHVATAPAACRGRSSRRCCTLPSGPTKPPCAVPVWTLILLMPTSAACPCAAERLVVALHERVQLVDVGVLAAHLADLAAHRDRHALRLVAADEGGEVGGQLAVHRLLLVERRPGRGRPASRCRCRCCRSRRRSPRGSARAACRAPCRDRADAYFLAFTWKWSPCRKSGPRKPSRSAAASMIAAYSCGRCSV